MSSSTIDSTSQLLAKRAAQVQRGGARAAVLGYNDGLVSTLIIVVTVAASGAGLKYILLSGFAGLLAGAVSMAAGEWVSVKAQVELFEGILNDLKKVIANDKALLVDNLARRFELLGAKTKDAQSTAKDIAQNDETFLTVYASEVIGMNKDELGSPWRAAGSSFLLFTIGAVFPLAAWVFGFGDTVAIGITLTLSAIGGLFVGGYTAHSSGKNIWYGALRQLVIIVFAATATYGIGMLFGVAVG